MISQNTNNTISNKIANNKIANKLTRYGGNQETYKPIISIFIDGNNMYYTQQKNGWFFEPKKIIEYFKYKYNAEVNNAYWYTNVKDENDAKSFINELIKAGFTVRTKPVKEFTDPITQRISYKRSMEIDMAIDMFNTVHQYDLAVLFTGNGDFERAVELLRSKNTRIIVVSTEGVISRELRNASDSYIEINQIRQYIEKKSKKILDNNQNNLNNLNTHLVKKDKKFDPTVDSTIAISF